jgi:hypothetical protein
MSKTLHPAVNPGKHSSINGISRRNEPGKILFFDYIQK